MNPRPLPPANQLDSPLCRANMRMAYEGLNRSEVIPLVQESSSKGMPDHVLYLG
jgi:hypothetical protein